MPELSMVFDRLYTAITYALLQFTHQALLQQFSSAGVLIVLSVTSAFLFCLERALGVAEDSVVVLLRRFGLLVLAQTAINSAARDLTASESAPLALRTECVAATTMLLMVVHGATHLVHNSAVLSRSVTLLLYMYTDALEIVLHSLVVGAAAVVVAVLVYVLLSVGAMQVQRGFSLSVLVRGSSMVCINVILRSISNESWDLHTKAGTLVFFLFMSDFAVTLLPMLDEVRGYILWKSAQIIYTDILQLMGDVHAGMLLGVLLFLMRSLTPPGSLPESVSTALQLTALVVVNMVLGPLSTMLDQMRSIENVLIAFNVVILVSIAIQFLRFAASGTKAQTD